MKLVDGTEVRTGSLSGEQPLTMGADDAAVLQSAIVDAAIAFRLANLEYDECYERGGTANEMLCDSKLACAVQNKSMLFALVDKLLTRHPINA